MNRCTGTSSQDARDGVELRLAVEDDVRSAVTEIEASKTVTKGPQSPHERGDETC
jgi:hypothetical protein